MDGSVTACCGLGAGRNNVQLPKRRIVIIGQPGVGKSSLGNTIFKDEKFKVGHDEDSGTSACETKTKRIADREITLIDMPGLFDPGKDEKELKPALLRCITECSPGPHAFLIVLKVEENTDEGQDITSKMNEYFSDEVFRYATVVFTHGDRLPRRQKIKAFVEKNKILSDLVRKCGDRCHVVDNQHWSKRLKYGYRSNPYQVKKLLQAIEKTVEENAGGCYTNAMLQEIEKNINREEEHIAASSRNIPAEKIRKTAKDKVYDDLLKKAAGCATGALLGAIFGVATAVSVVVAFLQTYARVLTKSAKSWVETVIKSSLGIAPKTALDTKGVSEKETDTTAEKPQETQQAPTAEKGKAAEVTGGIDATAAGKVAAGVGMRAVGQAVVAAAALGAVVGGYKGCKAAEEAETPWEAVEKAAEAVNSSGLTAIKASQNFVSNLATAVFQPLLKEQDAGLKS